MDMVLERPKDFIEMDNEMSFVSKFGSGFDEPEETPMDCVKKAAREIQQALNTMEQVLNHKGTSEEVKERILKIIDAFSIDKHELALIIQQHFNKRP